MTFTFIFFATKMSLDFFMLVRICYFNVFVFTLEAKTWNTDQTAPK